MSIRLISIATIFCAPCTISSKSIMISMRMFCGRINIKNSVHKNISQTCMQAIDIDSILNQHLMLNQHSTNIIKWYRYFSGTYTRVSSIQSELQFKHFFIPTRLLISVRNFAFTILFTNDQMQMRKRMPIKIKCSSQIVELCGLPFR